jgi:SAM-dependent methyltransferase
MSPARAPRSLRRLPFSAKVLVERLSGRSIFEAGYYRESQLTRLLNLFAHIDVERLRGMRMLEVGAGLGHLGDAFTQLGFDVTSTDGRPEHVESMKQRGRQAFVLDLDKETDLQRIGADEKGPFDMVLSFGVLYHLARPEEFLHSCGEQTNILFLETAVSDHFDPVIDWVTERRGWRGQDQAMAGRACRPSPAWVEKRCRESGFTVVRDISTSLANWTIGSFDWQPRDDGTWRRDGINLRKMWICEKV